MKISDMRQARAKAADELMTLVDRPRAFEIKKAEIEEWDGKIKRAEVAMAKSAATARPVAGQDPDVVAATMKAYQGGGAPLFKDQAGNVIKAFGAHEPMSSVDPTSLDYGVGDIVKAAVTGDWRNLPSSVAKAGSAGIGPSGGFLVPSDLAGFVIDLARPQARVMQAGATTLDVPHGAISIATVKTDPAPAWKGENDWFATDQGAYGQITLNTRMLGVIVPLSLELVMTGANVNALVTNQLAQRIGLVLDNAAIFGEGTKNSPRGILSHDVHDVPVGGALSSYAPFSSAIGKCLAANAAEENLSVLYNSDTHVALDGLVDTLGQPLRPAPSFQRIQDRGGVYVANGIPTAGTPAATTAIVGDFSQVIFGMTTGLTLEISREGGYKDAAGNMGSAFGQGQVLIRAWLMADVAVQRPGFFAKVSDIRI